MRPTLACKFPNAVLGAARATNSATHAHAEDHVVLCANPTRTEDQKQRVNPSTARVCSPLHFQAAFRHDETDHPLRAHTSRLDLITQAAVHEQYARNHAVIRMAAPPNAHARMFTKPQGCVLASAFAFAFESRLALGGFCRTTTFGSSYIDAVRIRSHLVAARKVGTCTEPTAVVKYMYVSNAPPVSWKGRGG